MRYYGGKQKLLEFINEGVEKTGVNSGAIFCDLFSGTTIVSKFFKKKGYTVYANDFLEFSYSLSRSYIQTNRTPPFKGLFNTIAFTDNEKRINQIIEHLNDLDPKKGFIYQNYCPSGTKDSEYQRMYFTDINGMKIDAIREKLNEWKSLGLITTTEFHVLLSSLIEAVPFVANISGNYAAYLKHWDPRTKKSLKLKVPEILYSKRNNKAFKKDANELVRKIKTDILYLDPPYNTRQYAANYFLLEIIAEGWFKGSKPQIYGKTGMRPYETQKSKYCQKNNAREAFEDLVANAKTKYIILSYNDEGILSESAIKEILEKRGSVDVFYRSHRRYRSINQSKQDRREVKEKLYFVKVNNIFKR